MSPSDAVREMVRASGMSAYAASRKAGRASAYISVLLSRGVDPSSRVLADIAIACGYTLQLVGHGEVIELDGTHDATTDATTTDTTSSGHDAGGDA